MGETYCRSIAVANFQGDESSVNITRVSSFNEKTLEDFSSGELDAVAGLDRLGLLGELPNDLSDWSSEQSGGHYRTSVEYYYPRLDKCVSKAILESNSTHIERLLNSYISFASPWPTWKYQGTHYSR